MGTWSWDRLASAGGLVGAALFVAGFLMFGEEPGIGDSGADVVSFYTDSRTTKLSALVLVGVAVAFFLWFAGAVANHAREAGQGRLAATIIAAGSVAFGLFAMVLATAFALAWGAAQGDAGAIVALNQVHWAIATMASFPMALFIGAASVGLARGGVLPKWFQWFGAVGALLMALGGTVWARDGFWAPDGGYSFVTIVVLIVWTVVASGMLAWGRPAAVTTERAAVPVS